MNQLSNGFDLEERTAKFGEAVIDFCRAIKQDAITRSIIDQLVRSGTSSVRIIWKRMPRVPEKISETKFLSARKKLKKRNIGYA